MELRYYQSEDLPAMAALFYETVHHVNAKDYSPEALDAWADGTVDLNAWDQSFRAHVSLVAGERRCWDSPIWRRTAIWIDSM